MKLLNYFKKLSGNSILESVISITIISSCFLVGLLVYSSVIQQNDSVHYYEAKHKITNLLYEIERTKNYEENSYNYEKYSIIKHTTILASEKVVLFKWVVKTGTKEYEFENLMPYDEEN